MARTESLDARQGVRVVDDEVHDPINQSFGMRDFDETDYLKVSINSTMVVGATEPGTERIIALSAQNDLSAVTDVHLDLAGKGNSVVLLPNVAFANLPAAASWNEGAIAYDTTNNRLVVKDDSVWRGVESQVRIVEAHTSGDTLLANESGSIHTNTGAGGSIILVLPVATVGLEFFFALGAAQDLVLDPNGNDKICIPETGIPGGAGKKFTAGAIGESLHLICAIAGIWNFAGGSIGTEAANVWAEEA